MEVPRYETEKESLESGFRISFITTPGGYHPLHWHDALEILYYLNGENEVTVGGKKYRMQKKHMIVIDSRQIHSTYGFDATSMFACIHISKAHMEKYVPGLELYAVHCTPDDLNDENFQDYLDICMLLQDLTRAYVRGAETLPMEVEGYLLQIFAGIIRHFSQPQTLLPADASSLQEERIREVISYVRDHFAEPLSLQEVADETGFSKEYFCRFFKKSMGMSFLQYLNEVRASYVYRDLENTDLSVAEIMEKNGFTNQKVFNRTFREIYGCTPISVKNHKSDLGGTAG